jgi:hypothetical protein
MPLETTLKDTPNYIGVSGGARSLNPLRAQVFKTCLYTNSSTLTV